MPTEDIEEIFMSANVSCLVVQNLQKSFKKRQVVKSFSLEIESGEVVGLLGPNGAGKTTSFYMIVGLIATDAGSVMLPASAAISPTIM